MKNLAKIEWYAAGFITLLSVWLHVSHALHAGPLWRDEANTAAISALPTIGDIWKNLEFDSFPIAWLLVVRVLHGLGMAGDAGLRFVGCLVGLAIVGVLWALARSFYRGLPLFSLALLAICPSLVIYGDSARAYGFGSLTGLVAFGFLWRYFDQPSWKRFAISSAASIFAAQSLYYNCIVIGAACAGGLALAWRRRDRNLAWQAPLAGVPAALTLLPYFQVFHRAGEWNILVQIDKFEFTNFWGKLTTAVGLAGGWFIWIWTALFIFALFVLPMALLRQPLLKTSPREKETIVFGVSALFAGTLSYYLFLKMLRYPTQPWYYLSLLAFIAVAIDAVAGASFRGEIARKVRLTACLVIAVIALPTASRNVAMRMSNIDLIAEKLKTRAGSGDLVLFYPWFLQLTYERYQSSTAEFATIPLMPPSPLHRYDIIKKLMEEPDQTKPVAPLAAKIETCLKGGHRIYLVGGDCPFMPLDRDPIILSPAPLPPPIEWSDELYSFAWGTQIMRVFQLHGVRSDNWPPVTDEFVNPLENPSVVEIAGWKN